MFPIIKTPNPRHITQTMHDYLWEAMYNNWHKQLLPDTEQIQTNFQNYYQKEIIDSKEPMVEIRTLSSYLIENIDRVVNVLGKIENFNSSKTQEKALLAEFRDGLRQFIERTNEYNIQQIFNLIRASSLLEYHRSKEHSKEFEVFFEAVITEEGHQEAWFFKICICEQKLAAKAEMHRKIESLSRRNLNSIVLQKNQVSMSLEYDENNDLTVHLSEKLARLMNVMPSVVIDLNNPEEKDEKIALVQNLKQKTQIIFSCTLETQQQEKPLSEETSQYIDDIVAVIPSSMVLYLPKDLPNTIADLILFSSQKHPKSEMLLCLDNPCRSVVKTQPLIYSAKPDHYQVIYKDSVFEPIFNKFSYQELIHYGLLYERSTPFDQQLLCANQLYSIVDIINFLINRSASTLYDVTQENKRIIGFKVPKKYEKAAQIFHRSLFSRPARDTSEHIIRFTRALEKACNTTDYRHSDSSIFSDHVMFLPQKDSDQVVHILPKDIKVVNENKSDQKLRQREDEQTGSLAVEAYVGSAKDMCNPFTREKLDGLSSRLFKNSKTYQLYYHGQKADVAANNLLDLDYAWHERNMSNALSNESNRAVLISRLNEMVKSIKATKRLENYARTFLISEIRYLAYEFVYRPERKCVSFFMWPLLEILDEDIEIGAFKKMKDRVEIICSSQRLEEKT